MEEERSKDVFELNEKLKSVEITYQDEINLLKEAREQELKVTLLNFSRNLFLPLSINAKSLVIFS